MDITPLVPEGRQIIQSYASGHFRVSGAVYAGPVVVFPDRTMAWGVTPALEALTAADFLTLLNDGLNGDLDVLLVGCGAVMRSMPFALRQSLSQCGVAIDFMDTGAACRTYNVLMAEGRRVAAALLPT